MSQQDDLIAFITQVSGETHLRVEENFGGGFVRLRSAEAERRQAKHDIRRVEDIIIEMLRNARDAQASQIFIATTKKDNLRELYLIDDGSGVPYQMHKKIFEPRVTSKLETMLMDSWGVHGRGMALYSISQNSREITLVSSDPNKGSAFRVLVSLEDIKERHDQSSWPSLEKDEDGVLKVGTGPHNIIRTIIEFCLEYPQISVYYGSPTEISATLYQLSQGSLGARELLFLESAAELPLYQRLACASDAADFIGICNKLYGFELSERSAHRILSGRIRALRPCLASLKKEAVSSEHSAPQAIDLLKDRRGLKLDKEDLAGFSRQLEAAFFELAEKYFLTSSSEPLIRVKKDCITVRFDFEKDD